MDRHMLDQLLSINMTESMWERLTAAWKTKAKRSGLFGLSSNTTTATYQRGQMLLSLNFTLIQSLIALTDWQAGWHWKE
jgi:hypothetical protein